ncbi:MAG TPA: Mut7-C RNAse domain-containing protein [Halanaerobiales bacterium]|nr:Mut7-C RNAse domain-containing protein [Halanaerobiales bacterium]
MSDNIIKNMPSVRSVYPYFHSLKLPLGTGLRVPYEDKPEFILDVHLGKLARYLRRFNFDSAYRNDYNGREIVETALKGNRIILGCQKDEQLT